MLIDVGLMYTVLLRKSETSILSAEKLCDELFRESLVFQYFEELMAAVESSAHNGIYEL